MGKLGAILAAVAALAGLVGYAVGVGIWAGGLQQVADDHDRRLEQHAQRIDRLEQNLITSQISLARIEEQLRTLVSAAVGVRTEIEPAEEPG